MKKSFLVICLIIVNLCFSPIFAQEAEAAETQAAADEQTVADSQAEVAELQEELPPFQVIPTRIAKPGSVGGFFKQWHVSFALEPTFIPNNAPAETTMPFAFTVPVTVGVFWKNNFFISVEPNLSFSMNYYIWDQDSGMAYYAEVENRTALALSFLVEIPLIFTINVSRKSSLKLSAGVAANLRFGFLAMGVGENEWGTSGTAKGDVEKINEWFWKDAHFMNFGFGLAWMFDVGGAENPIEVGPEVKFRMPMSNSTPNPFMLSVGLKVIL